MSIVNITNQPYVYRERSSKPCSPRKLTRNNLVVETSFSLLTYQTTKRHHCFNPNQPGQSKKTQLLKRLRLTLSADVCVCVCEREREEKLMVEEKGSKNQQ